jgi:hypothetical protein
LRLSCCGSSIQVLLPEINVLFKLEKPDAQRPAGVDIAFTLIERKNGDRLLWFPCVDEFGDRLSLVCRIARNIQEERQRK